MTVEGTSEESDEYLENDCGDPAFKRAVSPVKEILLYHQVLPHVNILRVKVKMSKSERISVS